MSGDPSMRAALALENLSQSDRDWLLAQLGEDERQRLLEVLHADSAEPASEVPAVAFEIAGDAPDSDTMRYAALRDAELDRVRDTLDAEPGWLKALVLNFRQWPWLPAWLATMDEAELAEMDRLARTVVDVTTRHAREAMVALVAEKLAQRPNGNSPTTFEAVLARLKRERQPAAAEADA